MARFESLFVVGFRPNHDGSIGIDDAFDMHTVSDQRVMSTTFRSRYNPDIRYVLLPMPFSTTVDKLCDGIMALEEEERLALYRRGKAL